MGFNILLSMNSMKRTENTSKDFPDFYKSTSCWMNDYENTIWLFPLYFWLLPFSFFNLIFMIIHMSHPQFFLSLLAGHKHHQDINITFEDPRWILFVHFENVIRYNMYLLIFKLWTQMFLLWSAGAKCCLISSLLSLGIPSKLTN